MHRLDKETSGLLLVAKTDRAHRMLGAAMAEARDRSPLCGAELGAHLDGGRGDGRQAHRARSARPKAHGNRQYGAGGTNGLRAARAVRRRGPAARAPAHRAHAPDSRASLVHRTSGGGRRHVRRRWRAKARLTSGEAAFSACGMASLSPSGDGEMVELRSALPPDLVRSIVSAAGPDVEFADTDPLEYFGFFRDDL